MHLKGKKPQLNSSIGGGELGGLQPNALQRQHSSNLVRCSSNSDQPSGLPTLTCTNFRFMIIVRITPLSKLFASVSS